jgi:hypothetical protein
VVISIARGPIRWILRWRGFAGITLPPFGIFIIEERLQDERLIRHEKEHWRQAQELGTIKFYARYLWYSLRYGYWNNPLEVQARKAEDV